MHRAAPQDSGGWSPLTRAVAVTLWTSFLVACLESMVVFALFDPAVVGLQDLIPPPLAYRSVMYALGFFSLWLFSFMGTAMTAFLLTP